MTKDKLRALIKEVIKEQFQIRAEFENAAKNLFSRFYHTQDSFIIPLKEVMNQILAVASAQGLEGLRTFDTSSYTGDLLSATKHMLKAAMQDLRNGKQLPHSVNDFYDAAGKKYEENKVIHASRKAEEDAKKAAQQAAWNALSPEEKERERARRERAAVYGGEENMRKGYGLGT